LELRKGIENRWMPPSPHKEEVLKFLERGRAHIEERGHNIPPLLVFEDGGVMELPLARYKDGNFSPAQGETASRQTSYYDVCGTIEELKKLLKERPELVESEPDRFFELIEDMRYMLSRMQRRREKYREFAEAVASVSERLNQIAGPDVEDAYQRADKLRDFLKDNPEKVTEGLQCLNEMAEGIRKVANAMESQVLYVYRDLAIELAELYAQIKGSRKWKKKDK
jgi:gas vesicle protein